jgi:hypothetical protein
MIKNIKWLLLASIAIVSCTKDSEATVEPTPEVPVVKGSADFSKYVALGNSLTAGFSDNALFKKGQEGSYTNLMAQQFKLVGGGEFKIPFTNDNIGGLLIGGFQNPALGPRLYFNGVGPVPVVGPPTTEVLNPAVAAAGPYNNTGVPGAKSFHLLSPTYGSPAGLLTNPPTANPYYVRFAPNGTTSVLQYAMAQTPTFFSLWIGNNDVLGYATTGGDGTNPITPATGVAGVGFDGTYTALINTLTSGGAKGVVGNIPYVNTIPFFTTVGFNPATLSPVQVDALNSGYAAYNNGLIAAKNLGLITEQERLQRTITFKIGKNAVVMIDEYLTDITAVNAGLIKMRQTTKDDYVVLSSQGVSSQAHLLAGNGTATPLQDRWVLSKSEVAELKTATDAYNVTIKSLAEAKGLAFVDANALLFTVANGGIRFGQYHLSSSYVVGGAFSMDGVHPAPQGYALIANEFLKAINLKYGSTFRGYDITNFPIQYPAVLPN